MAVALDFRRFRHRVVEFLLVHDCALCRPKHSDEVRLSIQTIRSQHDRSLTDIIIVQIFTSNRFKGLLD